MTLPMDNRADAPLVDLPDPGIADLARGANGLGETGDLAAREGLTGSMTSLLNAGVWSMAALSLAGMSLTANMMARAWGLRPGSRENADNDG